MSFGKPYPVPCKKWRLHFHGSPGPRIQQVHTNLGKSHNDAALQGGVLYPSVFLALVHRVPVELLTNPRRRKIPPQEVFQACFGGLNTFSGGVWMSRESNFWLPNVWDAKVHETMVSFQAQMSVQNRDMTFHYTAWLMGILDPYNDLLIPV